MLKEISSIWSFDESLRPFVPMFDARFRKGGKVLSEKRRWMPGYVFIESELAGMDFYILSRSLISWSEYALKLLRYGSSHIDMSYEMKTSDHQTFQRLFGATNCIDMSKGLIEGDKILITEGVLVGLEGFIKKIDRHKMLAYVEIEMFGATRIAKFGLEVISKK
ncbi:MAG: antitermination protein NusG [Defluviitaleaceae bacterium]|nr:antitermination protein NusG [Defluviitaleaceae bacterium]